MLPSFMNLLLLLLLSPSWLPFCCLAAVLLLVWAPLPKVGFWAKQVDV